MQQLPLGWDRNSGIRIFVSRWTDTDFLVLFQRAG